jgi:hypothetical protein
MVSGGGQHQVAVAVFGAVALLLIWALLFRSRHPTSSL